MSRHTFYITTPIFYPNADLHVGHAYVTTISDVLARYHRLIGDETYFLTGTDENTEKVVKVAQQQGVKPEQLADDVVQKAKKLFASLNISHNQFIRTSDEKKHWPGAIEMWNRLVKSGDIYKGEYKGLYCVGCESFKTEKDLDEKGNCPDHDEKPKIIKEENYFFKLSKYTKPVKERIESDELKIVPESRKKEILSLLEGGLEDISFSRPRKAVPWGIPVPGDEDQVIYVWCDALTNYISALGFGTKDTHNFKTFWPADYHVIGKDILRFHAAIWPAMLLSARVPLPKAIFVHGMILSGGKKMSKTLGNIVKPQDLIEKYGSEALRYYFAREVNPVEDGDLTEERFKEVYNANLANGIGNLTSRILKMVEQYDIEIDEIMFDDVRTVLSSETAEEYHDAFNEFRIDRAADIVWGEVAFMDSYITEAEPYKTIKEDEDKAHQDIIFLVGRLWEVSVLLEPFLPDTAEKIQKAIRRRKVPESLFPRK